MWASNNAIKRTLSGIEELVFDTAGCLKDPTGLAEYLDKELIKSAIHSLNTTFEQEEKLILAYQLRNYIDSSHYQELIKSKKLNVWKNFIKSLPFLHVFYVTVSIFILIVLIALPYTWPLVLGGVLLTGSLPALSLWLKQRIHFRLAQTTKIKNENKLTAFVKTTNQTAHPVNPLFIARESKLFEECPPPKFPHFPDISASKLAKKLAAISNIPGLDLDLIHHIGHDSEYQQKESLKAALELVYYRLNGKLDEQLGKLPEKAMLLDKLMEGITACTPGFHNRVNTILASFQQPQSLSELLYLVRKSLVEKATFALTNEIHTANDFTKIAKEEGLGVQPNFSEDIYSGKLQKKIIQFSLQSQFENNYTLFNLPVLLVDSLRGILLEMGYTGAKKKTESYTIGCADCEVDKFTESIKKYLPNHDSKKIELKHFFIIDEENCNILDVNWKSIEHYFFDLLKQNYFSLPSFDDFSKYLLPLLSYKNKQASNYLILLAQYQPESLKLLFYYLQQYSNDITKKIKEQLIPLFFEKNKYNQNAVQLAAQYHPKSLIVLVNFIDQHIDQFDLEINDFLLLEKYHPDSLNIILDFTEKHLTYADKQIISMFFLEKNDTCWNSFVTTARYQPKTALTILNYIIKHPEMFSSKTCSDQSLFKENLAKIQHGLSSLMAINKPDFERTHILLKFISLYPELLAHVPKTVAQFIFRSFAVINDEKLIDKLFDSHSTLLLNYFSINHFTKITKSSPYILGKILCAYHAELTSRSSQELIYTNFFKLGFPVHEKLNALQTLLDILVNNPDCEKKEKLNTLKKTNDKALTNGRLGQFFKLCCNNDSSMVSINLKIYLLTQPQRLEKHVLPNTPALTAEKPNTRISL